MNKAHMTTINNAIYNSIKESGGDFDAVATAIMNELNDAKAKYEKEYNKTADAEVVASNLNGFLKKYYTITDEEALFSGTDIINICDTTINLRDSIYDLGDKVADSFINRDDNLKDFAQTISDLCAKYDW